MSKPLTDVELELEKARLMAKQMDLLIEALFKAPTFEISVICSRCGKKSIRHSTNPKSPAEIIGVCDRCLDS